MTDLALEPSGPAFFLSGSDRVSLSLNWGESWEPYSGDLPANYGVYCLGQPYPSGPTPRGLLASNDLGIYYSDDGLAWTQVSASPCRSMDACPTSGGPVAAAAWSGSLLFSPNAYDYWIDETGDLPGAAVDLAFSTWDDGLYVVTSNRGVYRTFGFPVAAPEPANDRFALQAWPTPFNPETRIRFELPEAGRVELAVFDAAGRRVATLLSDELAAGSHEVEWRAESLASGVYLARLATAGGRATTKLLLLK